MIFLILFGEFFKIGLFSIGGGLATLPFLYKLAEVYPWLQAETIPDIVAAAQFSPGAIGVNISLYVGFRCAGPAGGLAAALGLIAPSIIIIIITARMLTSFKKNRTVAAVFSGLRPAAAGLLAAVTYTLLRASLWKGLPQWRECVLFAVLFIAIRRFKQHPIIYIAAAGAAGIIWGL
ncbi:MAG: chromate transporter [Spirochaetaceae bacterium]|jgi:chromate transporter|nr:chromate transporter [Spirochaetaceae bacterium]